jgi:polar amino acid transport system permease protein
MFASGITSQDYWLMAEGAWRTMLMTLSAGLLATLLGMLLGFLKLTPWVWIRHALDNATDVLRCVPLLVQVTLVYAGFAVIGAPISAFSAGTLALGLFAAGYISEIVRESVLAVPHNLRRAARGLGMTPAQEYRYVVVPLGIRQGFPSWLGIVLGIIKDTSVVAVIGYIELLRATQNIITRTQDPLPLLTLAALFYFVICFPLSLVGRRFERIINRGAAQ